MSNNSGRAESPLTQGSAGLEGSASSSFSEFQKSEYEHIAEAHFKAIEAISVFFRYYLIVMALPVPLLAVLSRISSTGADFEKTAVSLLILASPFFIVIGIVGLCMMVYITNMKMDVTLYSRVVNSIRKYFYDAHGMDHANKLLMRQLPQSAHIPSYRDLPFTSVVAVFALVDSAYLALGAHLLATSILKGASSLRDLRPGTDPLVDYSIIVLVALAFAAHFVAYLWVTRHREFSYLRSTAIGIDIDGVLNRHREHFCEMAMRKIGKQISADQIKLIPVHENPDLKITRNEEREILNDPTYWLDMPPMAGAADAIKSIKNALLLPVHIFTHRPWPDVTSADANAEFRQAWRAAASEMLLRANAKACVRLWVYLIVMFKFQASIRYVTKYWLHKHGIPFDSLLVERGNENIVYSRGRYENRFNYAKRRRIRFFVEDDWEKALKLSYICDVVFLIDHPYNRAAADDSSKHAQGVVIGRLPANVIRVTSWVELKKIVRQLV